MPRRSRELGFTLVELVAILVVMGALAFFAMPRLRISDSSLLTSRDAIIAALSHAQQIAMARDSASNPVTLVVTSSSIEVQENGAIVTSPGADYPLTFPSGVSITGGLGTLEYDKLGRTSPSAISLNGGQATVSVEASGYAY